MLRSSGPGQVLGSKVANRVLAIRLVQWLGWVFGTEERKKESTWQVKFDKLRLSSWLVTNNKKQHTIASGPPSNHLTSDSLSSQLVKSTWKVTPLKSHQQDFPRTPPKGYLVGGQVTVMAKKRSKSITFFFWKKISGENDVLGIILRCSPPRKATLQFDSVAAALVNYLQQSVDSTWGETGLLLLTVCSCLFILMFY